MLRAIGQVDDGRCGVAGDETRGKPGQARYEVIHVGLCGYVRVGKTKMMEGRPPAASYTSCMRSAMKPILETPPILR